MFGWLLGRVFQKSLGMVVIYHLYVLLITNPSLKQLILDWTRQYGHQTVLFGVYVHNLMFVFILELVFQKESRCGCDITTWMYWLVVTKALSILKQLILDHTRQNVYIKQFNFVCTFVIWCLILIWNECS